METPPCGRPDCHRPYPVAARSAAPDRRACSRRIARAPARLRASRPAVRRTCRVPRRSPATCPAAPRADRRIPARGPQHRAQVRHRGREPRRPGAGGGGGVGPGRGPVRPRSRGVDFLSFAVPTITGEVQRYFRDRFTPIRLPRRLRQLQSQIYDAAGELGQRHGRAPGRARSRDTSGWRSGSSWRALAAQGVAHTSSLDEPRDERRGRLGRTRRGWPGRSRRPNRSSIWSSTARASVRCWPRCPSGSGGSCCCASSVG